MENRGSIEYLECDNETLLLRARCGDQYAVGELIVRHNAYIRRIAFSFLRQVEDAEDVAQEVSLCLVKKLHTFEGKSTFSTWLTRIVINQSLMRLRQLRRGRVQSLEALMDGEECSFLPLADISPSPEAQCANRQLARQLRDAIRKLPSQLRDVVNEQVYTETPIQLLAKQRGLSVAATKSRAYRGRRILIHSLGKIAAQMEARSASAQSKV